MARTFGSLFAGIGGLDLGLSRAGWECRFQVEIAPYCRAVLKKHWPDVPRFGDIKEVSGDELPRVDLLCGGFPCQPVSVAGRRGGTADDRWLWPEFARLVGALRPRYVLVENTPGLLTLGMGEVLGDLSRLGYDAEWSLVSACAMGAPHTRERLFIVADADDELGTARVRSIPEHDRAGTLLPPRDRERRQGWLAAVTGTRGGTHGLPADVDRLGALGNAVVPQVAEWIGRLLAAGDSG